MFEVQLELRQDILFAILWLGMPVLVIKATISAIFNAFGRY